MAKINRHCCEVTGHPAFICDFSPPRSGLPAQLPGLLPAADFLLAAYNPGRSVRVNSVICSACLRQQGHETAFALATRDMNRLAIQSLLLGAQLLGLENVVVVQGDPFNRQDLAQVRPVDDYTTTDLIAAIRMMNQGQDLRGYRLAAPTDFCIGATVDLNRGLQREARLACRKVTAGARFLISQPIYDPLEARRFLQAYHEIAGEPLLTPVFWGLQMLEAGGIAFGRAPESHRSAAAAGRSSVSMAAELYGQFREAGFGNFYLLPPIRPGGDRNYAAAQELLTVLRGG